MNLSVMGQKWRQSEGLKSCKGTKSSKITNIAADISISHRLSRESPRRSANGSYEPRIGRQTKRWKFYLVIQRPGVLLSHRARAEEAAEWSSPAGAQHLPSWRRRRPCRCWEDAAEGASPEGRRAQQGGRHLSSAPWPLHQSLSFSRCSLWVWARRLVPVLVVSAPDWARKKGAQPQRRRRPR